MSFFTPQGRSRIETATGMVAMLAFFFAIGLAGGTYFFRSDEPDQTGSEVAQAGPSPGGPAELAPSLAQVEPTAPAAVRPPPIADTDQAAAAPPAMTLSSPPAAEPASIPSAAALLGPTPPRRTNPAPGSSRTAPHSPKIPARPAPLARAATAPAAGPVRIQFGAFASEENARRVQWAVEATGMQIEVTRTPKAAGRALYTLRSPPFPDTATAVGAAAAVRDKVQHFVNAVPIEYGIVSNQSGPVRQADLSRR